ncbi:LA_0442/LA_0875 N-terminal domain-containing protein [Spirochaetota bacterium]
MEIKRSLVLFFSLLIAVLSVMSNKISFAEVIYLKNGKVINGAIVGETKNAIRIKTKDKTHRIKRKDVVRIMYGERKLERIFIQLKDNTLVDGYMIDQDSKKIIFRPEKDVPKEVTVMKSNIQQLSNERILMLMPEISFRSGIFLPVNAKEGSELDLGVIFFGGFGIRLPFIDNSRIQFEIGYVKNTSKYEDYIGEKRERVLYTMPVLVNYIYSYNMYDMVRSSPGNSRRGFWNTFLSRTYLVGKIGGGISYLNYDNGEGDKYQGVFGSVLASVGFSFEIVKGIFYFQLANDFLFVIESSAVFVPYIFTLSLNYRY